MRIFLCYAAERLAVAEQVDAALEAEGHQVFFARDSIAAATPFGRAIRQAVGASDLFVFLVSPEAVEPGSYCLTELGFARDRWPDPARRVLPVVVAATPPDSYPPYLQSLSVLHPAGNVAAEVVASVERLERKHPSRRRRTSVFVAAALSTVAIIGAVIWVGSGSDPALPFVSVASIVEVRPEIAEMPALVLVRGNVRNPRPRVDSIVELVLDLGGDVRAAPEDNAPILVDANGGENFARWFRVSAAGDSLLTPRRWRTCVVYGDRAGRTCGFWSVWDAGQLAGGSPLSQAQRRRSRVVASGPEGFLVGLAGPDELLLLGSGGKAARTVPLPGEPTAIAAAGDRVVVGTRAPGVLVVLGPRGARSEYRVPAGTLHGSETSTGVGSLALTEHEAWVITGGYDGEPAVRMLDLTSKQWVTLPYADDRFSFDPRGVSLRSGDAGDIWGVAAGTTPSSLYRLTRRGVEETAGHQVPAVACAGDVEPAAQGTVHVLSCDGGLLRGRPSRHRFAAIADRDLRLFPSLEGDWRAVFLAADGDAVAVAITVLKNVPGQSRQEPLMSRVAWAVPGSTRARIGFERDSIAVMSLAARDSLAMATVTSSRGMHDVIVVPLGPP